MCVLFFVFLSIFIENSVTAFHVSDSKEFIEKLSFGVRVAGVYLSFDPPVSLFDCSMECIYRRRCKSFNYSYNMKYCELSTREINNVEIYPKSDISHRFVHSNARKWLKHLRGKCANNRCPLNTKCIAETGNCNYSDCGPAENIENMKGPESGNFAVGNGAVYRCKKGQEMVDGNGNLVKSGENVAQCTETAEWKINNYTCKNTRVPVRMVERSFRREGFVEAFVEGQWRTIADGNWTHKEALVACRSLGYTEGKLWSSEFSRESVAYWMTDITCTGNEENINDCHRNDLTHSYKKLVTTPVVLCNPVLFYKKNSEKYTKFSGRVQMCLNSQWFPICGTTWNKQSADVACHSRWNGTSAIHFGREFGIVLKSVIQVSCNGSWETTLYNCTHRKVEKCFNGLGYAFCTDPNTRLVGGRTSRMGGVEIYRDNVWKRLLDEVWTDNDAKVICRSLGYSEGMALIHASSEKNTNVTWATNVTCLGSEKYLHQCSRRAPSQDEITSEAHVICDPCKTDWKYASLSCYYFSNIALDWTSAQRFCEEKGSNLVKVDDEEENNRVKSYKSADSRIWLGATDIQKEDIWTWVSDNASLLYKKWLQDQPDNFGGNEHCLELVGEMWNDENCNEKRMFLCEQKVTMTTQRRSTITEERGIE